MKICICTTPIRPEPTEFPPFGSMAIIQALRSIGEEVRLYHIDYHRYDHAEISKYFTTQKFDMVGISAVVSTAYAYTKYLTHLIKKVSPKTIVFVGGYLASSAEILHRKANADYCVIGDGEIIVQNLVKAVKEKKIQDKHLNTILGITYINSQNKFVFNGYDHPLPAPMIERPDYSILEDDSSIDYYIPKSTKRISDYYKGEWEVGKRKATVVVAKGCVARCTFCHRFEKGYRVSPIDNIIEHLKMLKEKYNVKYLTIGDENFGSYKEETIKLIKAMKSLGFVWRAGGVRAHTVNFDILKLWKENGCINATYGIESGSPTMLKIMEKKISLEQNIEALKATYQAGLSTTVQLVIAMPGETDKTIEETIDFLIKTMPYYPDIFRKRIALMMSINYAQALPGTPLYEYAREHGYIGSDLESEEAYLLKISDTDAYDNDHFINYTQQPLLKVFSWRTQIYWKVFRKHTKNNFNISISKLNIILSLFIISLNQIFKTKIESPLKRVFDQFELDVEKDPDFNTYNYSYFQYGLKLLLPWNKFTYPFIIVLIAFKEAKNTKWFFKLIFDHIKWSLNIFKKINLPKETLRKIVNIKDTDASLEIRRGQ